MMQDRSTNEGSPARSTRTAGTAPPPRRRRAGASFAHRRWVFRSTVLLALAAAALCFFVSWRRDELTIQARLKLLAGPVAELQSEVDAAGGHLWANPPKLVEWGLSNYVTDADREYASQASGPVIVAVTGPERMLFKSDGRVVILYDRGRISVKWMREREYNAAWAEQERKISEFEQKRKAQPIVPP